jgi:hypothetical protein
MYQKNKNSTQHGEKTPYGFGTPHKMPSKTSNEEDLLGLVSQLYPTGRAWYLPENGVFQNLHKAINVSFLRFVNDSYNLIDGSFPDNVDFDENDCDLWEYRLGLITNSSLSLNQRRTIILRKMAYPQNQRLRQGYRYIQEQLNLYGFNVGVYENIFYDINGDYYYKLPSDILSQSVTPTQHGGIIQHGTSTQHGAGNFDVIANNMYQESYNFGGVENLWATFYIAGPNSISDYASIPSNRKAEFRELVLKLKPAHTIAFTFINY